MYKLGYKPQYDSFELFLDEEWEVRWIKAALLYGITIVVLFPLCLQDNVAKMRFIAIFALFSFVYVIGVVVIQSPWFVSYYQEKDLWKDLPWVSPEKGFDHNMFFFRGWGVIAYSLVTHSGALPVLRSLKNNEIRRRVHKVIARTVIVQYSLYVFLAICGFMTAPFETPEIIIYRHNYVFSNDIFMIIGIIAVIIVLAMIIPVKYNALRLASLNLFLGTSEISKRR